MTVPNYKWKKVSHQNGSTPRPRHGHRAVSFKNLIITLGGGNGGIVDDLNIFNTSNFNKTNLRSILKITKTGKINPLSKGLSRR
jgi:hypothetical protein